jgi:hypothetical protein
VLNKVNLLSSAIFAATLQFLQIALYIHKNLIRESFRIVATYAKKGFSFECGYMQYCAMATRNTAVTINEGRQKLWTLLTAGMKALLSFQLFSWFG